MRKYKNLLKNKDLSELAFWSTLVSPVQRISLLDGYSGYNQILVYLADQLKTTFTTPWGTFMYVKIPFGLMNAGETFQRAMDIAFSDRKSVV